MISFRFDIESEQNFELKIEKLYSFRLKIGKKNACLRQSKAFRQHFNALEMYLLSFEVNFKLIFGVQKRFFGLECQRFAFFVTKTIRFLTFNFLNSKLPFVLFGFRYFPVVFERISFYFHFDHNNVRIKQIVSFQ
jgi:hypothetical protein